MTGKSVGNPEVILLANHPFKNTFGPVRFYGHADPGPFLQKCGNDIWQMAGGKAGKTGNPDMPRTLLIWPYAVAPAVAGVLWLFMFNTRIGLVSWYLGQIGYEWNHVLNGGEAMGLVVVASAWGRISYNFLFFFAALQAVPRSVIEAAAIDGARFWRRFFTIVLPLLSPTTFFLLVANIVYSFFETFGVIHTITSGGPQQSTTILVYKVFSDGFVGQDLGSSSAQSVILLVIVGLLTVIQFKYIEKRVHY